MDCISGAEDLQGMGGGWCYLNTDAIETIKKILAKGDRVELIPVKNGVKIIRVRREEIIPGSKR